MSDEFRDLDKTPPQNRGERPREASATGSSVQDPHLLDYVRVLYKRRWIASTAFVVVVVLVAVYSFTVTPVYQATTKLLIETENPNVVNFKEVIDEEGTKLDYYQTQYNILMSRSLARRTIDALKLWDKAELGAAGASASSIVPGETARQSRQIDAFLARLSVMPVRNSRIVDVRFRSKDPVLAAQVVNTLARGYIEQTLEYKLLSSKEATDWLSGQLAAERKRVEAAEAALQRYKEANDAISLEDRQNIYVQKLADLNAAVTRAKTVRLEKEALYNQLRQIQANGNPSALDAFPAILGNTFIQQQKSELSRLQSERAQMAEKLGERHPDMVRLKSAIEAAQAKLMGEIEKVVQSVRNEYVAAQAQESSLVSALDAQKREALAMNRKGIEYGVLQREAESSRQIYDSLLQRAKETGVSAELRTSNIRIVDPAEVPDSPASPKRTFNMLLALLGGALLGIGLAFLFEYLESRIDTPDDIRAYLGLASLGMVPALDAKTLGGKYPLVTNGVPGAFSEAFRAVRTNVVFSSAEQGSRSVLVTSTGPAEGKTMVASNLAVSLAQAGQRVLIIDADMRKPKLGEAFGVKEEPGLSNLLVGTVKASESIRKGPVAGLWLLPAGKLPPNPSELLASERFRDLLASLADHFDWVVIDSPPILAVADAAVVAHKATGVVFVVGAEMTSRNAAVNALKQLETAKAKIVGAVLNRVQLSRNGYYYSAYYRREYSKYYSRLAS